MTPLTVHDGDQVRSVVDEGSELRGPSSSDPPQEQPHRDRRDRSEDAERDADDDETGEAGLRVRRHLSDRVVGDARHLGAGDSQVEELFRETRFAGRHPCERFPARDHLLG